MRRGTPSSSTERDTYLSLATEVRCDHRPQRCVKLMAFLPTLPVVPKPHQLWDKPAHSSIFPLMLLFSIAWGLEMCVDDYMQFQTRLLTFRRVTHLEGTVIFGSVWPLTYDHTQSCASGYSLSILGPHNRIGSAAITSKHGASDLSSPFSTCPLSPSLRGKTPSP